MAKFITKRGKSQSEGPLQKFDFTEGATIGNMDLLGDWTIETDKMIIY